MRRRAAWTRSRCRSRALGVSWRAAPARAEASPHLQRAVPAVVQRHRRHRVGPHAAQARPSSSSTRTRRQSATAQTRNFAYDSYPGVRVGSTRDVAQRRWRPVVVEYVPGTGIVHTDAHRSARLTLDEYDFAPDGPRRAREPHARSRSTQTGQRRPRRCVLAIFNYHLGSGSPTPGTDSETITYDAARDAYYESGPSGVALAYASLAPSTHHGCTPEQPVRPAAVRRRTWPTTPGTGGADDRRRRRASRARSARPPRARRRGPAGSRCSRRTPTARPRWTACAPGSRAARRTSCSPTRSRRGRRGPSRPPSGASALEAALAQQAQVVLRMGQVAGDGARRRGRSSRASRPGTWNIAWVRDMAYATVGLVRSGHYAEAKAAIAFQMRRQVGRVPAVRRRAVPDQRRAATTATAASGATRTPTAPTSSSTASASSSGSSTSTCRRAATRRRSRSGGRR